MNKLKEMRHQAFYIKTELSEILERMKKGCKVDVSENFKEDVDEFLQWGKDHNYIKSVEIACVQVLNLLGEISLMKDKTQNNLTQNN